MHHSWQNLTSEGNESNIHQINLVKQGRNSQKEGLRPVFTPGERRYHRLPDLLHCDRENQVDPRQYSSTFLAAWAQQRTIEPEGS